MVETERKKRGKVVELGERRKDDRNVHRNKILFSGYQKIKACKEGAESMAPPSNSGAVLSTGSELSPL